MNDTTAPEQPAPTTSTTEQIARATKANLLRVVPTDRVSFKKQVQVLRAYAAASTADKIAVSYNDVASVMSDIVGSSVSLVTPFFVDVGLLTKDGTKFRPNDALFDYVHAFEWNAETAGVKLFRAFADSWAGKTLMPRVAFRQLTKDEAIAVLAEESRASKAHRNNLETLLEFLNLAGVVRLDGTAVTKGSTSASLPPKPDETALKPPAPPRHQDNDGGNEIPQQGLERFVIPIPDKSPATITVPRDLDADDWEMVKMMLETYIIRMQKRSPTK